MPTPNAPFLAIDEALTRFHNRWPGSSEAVFGRGTLDDGRSSYAWLVEPLRRGPVLDLGCGSGGALALLEQRGLEAVGVDRSQAELDIARQRGLRSQLLRADLTDLPLPAGRFEAVISHMALSLVPEPGAAVAAIDRVLAPGATLRAVVSRRSSSLAPAVQAYLDGLRGLVERFGPRVAYPAHTWDARMLWALLPGWQIEEQPLRWRARVPVEDAPSFLRVAFYASGLLEGEAEEALQPLVEEVIASYARDGALEWELALLGLVARKPF